MGFDDVWLKILGGLLFIIGLGILSPIDDIILLPFLILFFGPIIIPIITGIGLIMFILGAVILGVHIGPYLMNPIILLMLIISIIIFIYLFTTGWLSI